MSPLSLLIILQSVTKTPEHAVSPDSQLYGRLQLLVVVVGLFFKRFRCRNTGTQDLFGPQ